MDRRSWAGLADGNNDGLLRTIASRLAPKQKQECRFDGLEAMGQDASIARKQASFSRLPIGEELVVQDGVKQHRHRLQGLAL